MKQEKKMVSFLSALSLFCVVRIFKRKGMKGGRISNGSTCILH